MPRESLSTVVEYLHRIAGGVGPSEVSDAELLDRFALRRDEAAFAILVWRHGPLVLGLCQRILRHEQDSEDVFQATFLTLARKANSIARKETLASWLYKVAYRIACRAGVRERAVTNHAAPLDEIPALPTENDALLRSVLDEEIARLPDSYSRPIILCYLEGKTHEEVARLLDCPKGTLSSRLARACERLHQRLTRRGLTLSAAALAVSLTEASLSAAVPAALARSTATSALAYVSGTAAAGALSAKAVILAEGVLQMMWYAKMRTLTLVLLAVVLAGSGIGLFAHQTWAVGAGDNADTERVAQEPKADAKSDIAALRAEIAKLRLELEAAVKEIKSLKEASRDGKETAPTFSGKTTEFWLNQLKDADPDFRANAIKAIGALAQKNKKLIPVVIESLKTESHYSPANEAVTALTAIGPDVLPALIELAKDKKFDTRPYPRQRAIEAIGRMGSKAKPAVPDLASILIDESTSKEPIRVGTSLAVIKALQFIARAIGPEAKEAIPALITAMGASLDEGGKSAGKGERFGKQSYSINRTAFDALLEIEPELSTRVSYPRDGVGLRKLHKELEKQYLNPK